MTTRKKNTLYWAILAVCGVLFYILNLYTPFQHDDFAYAFYYAEDSSVVRPTSDPITWSTLLPSMWHHYCCVNGRFTSHLLIQIFCGLLGKCFFNVCNSLIFIVFLHVAVRLSVRNNSVTCLSAIILALFLFFQNQGQTMLWLSGAINYLWTATFALCTMYYILNHDSTRSSWLRMCLMFAAGVFVGWMQESITIGLSAGLFIWYLLNRDKFHGDNAALVAGLWTGTILLVLSPGTYSRLSEGNDLVTDVDILQFISMRAIGMTLELTYCMLPLIAIIVSLLVLKNRDMRKDIGMLVLVFVATLGFVYLLGAYGGRIYFGVVTFSLVLILSYCSKIIKYNSSCLRIVFVLIALTISGSQYLKALKVAKAYTRYTDEISAKIKLTDGDTVVFGADPFKGENEWVLNLGYSEDKYNFHNRVRAFYYQKQSMQVLSPSLYSIYESSLIDSEKEDTDLTAFYEGQEYPVYRLPSDKYWLIELSHAPSISKRIKACFKMDADAEQLTNKQRFIRYLLNTLPKDQEIDMAFTLSDSDKTYILFRKRDNVDAITLK